MKQLKFNHEKDMKELEKYGFKLHYSCNTGKIEYAKKDVILGISIHSYTLHFDNLGNFDLCLSCKYSIESRNSEIDDLLVIELYDLIKANLLIVEEDNE